MNKAIKPEGMDFGFVLWAVWNVVFFTLMWRGRKTLPLRGRVPGLLELSSSSEECWLSAPCMYGGRIGGTPSNFHFPGNGVTGIGPESRLQAVLFWANISFEINRSACVAVPGVRVALVVCSHYRHLSILFPSVESENSLSI
jgi:hypothetical protein